MTREKKIEKILSIIDDNIYNHMKYPTWRDVAIEILNAIDPQVEGEDGISVLDR